MQNIALNHIKRLNSIPLTFFVQFEPAETMKNDSKIIGVLLLNIVLCRMLLKWAKI